MGRYYVGNLELDFSESKIHESKAELLELYWLYHPRFRFIKNTPIHSKFLDVGAGDGGLQYWKEWRLPPRNDLEMYAIDMQKGKLFSRYIDYQICNLDKECIKYDDNYFNVVFISHVLEHINDETRFILDVNRVLKNGGKLYIEIPTPETINYPSRRLFIDQGINVSTVNFFDDNSHLKTYDAEELKRLLHSNGFRILEYGVIENKYIEDKLFSYGIKNNDQELLTYSIWSKLRWAQYIIGEKV